MGDKQAQMSQRDRGRLRRAREFDRQALAAIYDTYHGPIYGYIYRRVGHVDVARDLSADVFSRLLEALRNGAGPDEHLRAWLYRTAHNAVIDHYRRQVHRDHLPLAETLVDGGPNPARQAEIDIQSDGVRWAIQQLTPDQQQVISLKFLSGMSNAEAAEIMEKPLGAVKSLQHRALAALRRLLIVEEERYHDRRVL